MANITSGQTISASISTTDPISVDGLRYYDEYNLPSLAGFSQLDIKLDAASKLLFPKIELINTATGDTVAQSYTQYNSLRPLLLAQSTFPGVNYKLRVSGGIATSVIDKGVGNYQLSVTDGGQGTSIVSPLTSRSDTYSVIGTVGRSGAFFSLGGIGGGISSNLALFDVAQTPNGQFYGFTGVGLFRIDPRLDLERQIKKLNPIRDSNGNNIVSYTLESSADGKLYAIGFSGAGVKLYQIDVTNDQPVATSLGTLSLETEFLLGGDLVFDAANNRFLATNSETSQTDALWQIPLSNPAGASKIGSIGFQKVYGLSFENGQLFGYTGGVVSYVPTDKNEFNRLKIDVASGKGTVDGAITGTQFGEAVSISGAATIVYSDDSFVGQTSLANFKKDPVKYMGAIRDYDGNNLGGSSTWKLIGDADINGDGTIESILVNPKIERFASVGSVGGNVDFTRHSLNGDTRVVGIYIDPTLKNNPEKIGGPFDSQRRLQNDLKIDNLKVLAAGDYNNDGFQDLYFKLGDGSAVLRALMFKDGNIQYANYQSKGDLAAFMTANNVNKSVWGNWL